MNENEQKPFDAFANINLDQFKTNQQDNDFSDSNFQPDKELIKKVAQQSDFQSRQIIEQKKRMLHHYSPHTLYIILIRSLLA